MTAVAVDGPYTQPMIPMVGKNGAKITLRLRKMSFAREIANLPSGLKKLQELMVEVRGNQNENVYMMVAVWNKLRVYERYWTSFKFASEAEYLAYYDLPEGATLAGWSIMVEYFEKETFILLGDEVLRYMMRSIGEHQDDIDAKKRDYQAIFDTYCGIYEGFDKQAFYRIARKYVDDNYVKPELKKRNMTREELLRQQTEEKRKQSAKKQRRFTPRIVPLDGQKSYPKVERDFTWKERRCPICARNAKVLAAAKKYIEDLEEVVRQHIGKDAIPHRPKQLQGL